MKTNRYMHKTDIHSLPYLLYADSEGRVYDHPYYRMAGSSGGSIQEIENGDLIPMPEFSKLFFIPDCPPIGLDPSTGEYITVSRAEVKGKDRRCYAVASFLEPGFVRSHLPAVDYRTKTYTLPMWGYTAVGLRKNRYWVSGFRIEHNPKWDPRNYDDRDLMPAIENFKKKNRCGPLTGHLVHCATHNHCFAAKNLFFERWEAPLPVSRTCNAECLGCLSLQPDHSCSASHQRISFRPDRSEIVSLASNHLANAPDAIVSFGQGCEGEPLMEHKLLVDCIREIRRVTEKGTINLNTNGSLPRRVREVAESGLDSIRISLNSARQEFYEAYYRPKDYEFEDVVTSASLSVELGLYTMVNYLVFPGITDQEEEIEALIQFLKRTGIHFLHMKNLNIDPELYIKEMPAATSRAVGMKKMTRIVQQELPEIELGYFNQPVSSRFRAR